MVFIITLIKYLIVISIFLFILRKAGIVTDGFDKCVAAVKSCLPIAGFKHHQTTGDTNMYSAILVKSVGCGFCTKQLKLLNSYGPRAFERIKVLDTETDAAEIEEKVGSFEAVPLWFNPLTGEKTTGLKKISELKDMGILF